MDRASRLLLVMFLVCTTAQAFSLTRGVEQRAAGPHPLEGFLENTNELHRRQDYGKSPVNWEQIWKLKALLDQVGRRK